MKESWYILKADTSLFVHHACPKHNKHSETTRIYNFHYYKTDRYPVSLVA